MVLDTTLVRHYLPTHTKSSIINGLELLSAQITSDEELLNLYRAFFLSDAIHGSSERLQFELAWIEEEDTADLVRVAILRHPEKCFIFLMALIQCVPKKNCRLNQIGCFIGIVQALQQLRTDNPGLERFHRLLPKAIAVLILKEATSRTYHWDIADNDKNGYFRPHPNVGEDERRRIGRLQNTFSTHVSTYLGLTARNWSFFTFNYDKATDRKALKKDAFLRVVKRVKVHQAKNKDSLNAHGATLLKELTAKFLLRMSLKAQVDLLALLVS